MVQDEQGDKGEHPDQASSSAPRHPRARGRKPGPAEPPSPLAVAMAVESQGQRDIGAEGRLPPGIRRVERSNIAGSDRVGIGWGR